MEVEIPTLYSVWWSVDLLLIDVQGLSKNKKIFYCHVILQMFKQTDLYLKKEKYSTVT